MALIDDIRKARIDARAMLEVLYEHKCTIIEYQNVKDPVTKQTKKVEVVVAEDVPCRISFKNVVQSAQTESSDNIEQIVKLFLAPEPVVKEGSKIIATYNGRTANYISGGPTASYVTHQEIVLELEEKYG